MLLITTENYFEPSLFEQTKHMLTEIHLHWRVSVEVLGVYPHASTACITKNAFFVCWHQHSADVDEDDSNGSPNNLSYLLFMLFQI